MGTQRRAESSICKPNTPTQGESEKKMNKPQQILTNARILAISRLYSLACEVDTASAIELAPDLKIELHLGVSSSHALLEARFYGFKVGENGSAISGSQFALPGFASGLYLGDSLTEDKANEEADRIDRELPLFIERVQAIIEGREKLETETETITSLKIKTA